MMKFVVYSDERHKWRWQLKAVNGLIIADSGQGYVSIKDCMHGIELVKTQSPNARVEFNEVIKQAIAKRRLSVKG